jgi:cysteine synthase A
MLRQVGNTPLIELPPLDDEPAATILAKLELFNPSGSVKDRIAKYIVEKAERRGELKPGMLIVEVTSGNTGIGFAMVGAAKGYKMRVLMPEHMSEERRLIMKALGAELILTPESEGFIGALKASEEMAAEDANIYLPRQFENPYNTEAHKLFTGTEIIHQTGGRVDAFVAGVGTGGTIMGVAEAFREAHVPARIVAVEPAEAAAMSGGEPGKHKIQGLGDGFVPNLINMSLIDTVETATSDDSFETARELTARLGLLVGISSGANVIAAKREAKRLGPGKRVVTVLPDRGERYFSTELYRLPFCV